MVAPGRMPGRDHHRPEETPVRASRFLVAALVLALLGLLPAAPTVAAARRVDATTSRSASAPPVAARAGRLTAKIVKRAGGELFLTGVIRPKKGPVIVQRATSCNRKRICNFTKYRAVKLDEKGRYTVRVHAPRKGSWAFRATKGRLKSQIWLTCVKRPGESCPIP